MVKPDIEKKVSSKKMDHDVSPFYQQQDAVYIRYIVLHEWSRTHLEGDQSSSITIKELLAQYTGWVNEHPEWTSEVIDTPASFSKKLIQLLNARALAVAATRTKQGRALSGVRWTRKKEKKSDSS